MLPVYSQARVCPEDTRLHTCLPASPGRSHTCPSRGRSGRSSDTCRPSNILCRVKILDVNNKDIDLVAAGAEGVDGAGAVAVAARVARLADALPSPGVAAGGGNILDSNIIFRL